MSKVLVLGRRIFTNWFKATAGEGFSDAIMTSLQVSTVFYQKGYQ